MFCRGLDPPTVRALLGAYLCMSRPCWQSINSTWTCSHAVSELNIIQKEAARMWPITVSTAATCLLFQLDFCV